MAHLFYDYPALSANSTVPSLHRYGSLAAVFVLAGGVKLTQPATRVRPLAPVFSPWRFCGRWAP
ncbi:hypothetical protein [Hymenobacter sp. YC55]|uniref:hypothetical protein n=1 Tax=Hymenobacter sp. YC55 TaxID=3034019 RepID=UPI0023F9BC32|nr:hypothetical protein [Hymenobacter sp. YC55]MDF7815871.1 hypothetical protein [Hymenobacter sp. YC55]